MGYCTPTFCTAGSIKIPQLTFLAHKFPWEFLQCVPLWLFCTWQDILCSTWHSSAYSILYIKNALQYMAPVCCVHCTVTHNPTIHIDKTAWSLAWQWHMEESGRCCVNGGGDFYNVIQVELVAKHNHTTCLHWLLMIAVMPEQHCTVCI